MSKATAASSDGMHNDASDKNARWWANRMACGVE